MTDEQKLQDYEARLELVKRHLDIDYKYSSLIGFENELEKFIKIIDNAERIKQENDDLTNDKRELEDEVSYLENKIFASILKRFKKRIKRILKNNEN